MNVSSVPYAAPPQPRNSTLIPLIVGFGINGWNVHRSLKSAGVAPLVLDDDRSSIFWAAKGIRIIECDTLGGPALIEALRKAVNPQSAYIIVSATEDAVRTLSERRTELPENVHLPFPEHAVVGMLLDKRKFYLQAVHGGFRISRMYFPETWADIPHAGEIQFPCILKGATKLYAPGLAKAYRIEDHANLYRTLGEISRIPNLRPRDFVVQEWVPGSDADVLFCMQYYGESGEPALSFVGRKIRQWRPETGGTASAEPAQNDEALRESTRFFRSIGMRGMCSMEFKRSRADGQLYMIEPTACRADFQEGVAVANGCNVPLALYFDALGVRDGCTRQVPRPVKWVNAGADYLSAAHYVSRGELTWWDWVRSLQGPKCYAIYAPEDRGPFIELMRRKIVNRLNRALPWKW